MRSRSPTLVYLTLLADAIAFFHKPLFSRLYTFPWDFHGVQLALITFLSDQLKQGRMALWNPYNYCGYPVFANIEACFFHPLVFLSALISSHTSLDYLPMLLEWIVVLQIWGAGIATYHLFRELGTGRASAWAGAIIFQTGGYFASRTEHIGAIMAVAWMPLAWLAVVKLSRGFRARWLAALAVALGMAVVGGFPQPTLAVFASTALLAVVLSVLRLGRAQILLWTACGCALGIALAAVQFIPTAQLTELSDAKFRAEWLGTGGGLYWQSLVSLVLPNHYNLFDLHQFKGPGDITFLYLYSSIAGLSLAVAAPFLRRTRQVALLVIMLLAGLLWMLGDKTALWRAVYPLLPETIRIGIHPEYTYCIFTLALAGLAAIGLDSLPISEQLRAAIGVVIAVDLFLVGSGRPMNTASVQQDPGVTRQAIAGSRELLDKLRALVNQSNPPWRIDTVDADINLVNCAPIMLVPNADGVSPLALADVIQARLYLHDGYRWGWYYAVQKVDSPVLDLLNVKYLVTRPGAAGPLSTNVKFRRADSIAGYDIYENLGVMPRFFLVHDVRSDGELDKIDLRHAALTSDPVSLNPGGSSNETDEVKVTNYLPDSLELAVQSNGPALLVMSESYYPGWEAWVDGQPAQIHKTDIAFRGVVIPGGRHAVRMEFHPTILIWSAAISLITALALMAMALSGAGNKRRLPNRT